MQNLGGGSSIGPAPAVSGVGPSRNSVGTVDGDLLKLRHYMRSKIFNILLQGQSTPVDDASRAKYMDVARRLEEGLLKMAVTKEEYMNPQTLEARLTTLIKGRQLNNFNQRHANSSSVGTMIPTPGLPHGGGIANLMVTSSVDASAIGVGAHSNATTTAVSAGSLLPYSSMHGGNLSNGFEQSSTNFSVGPLGNMSSLGSRTNSGQMIPTPGFVNSNNNNNKISNSNTQSYINMETSNNGSGFPAVDPASVTQQQQQRQHVGPQNSRILHNLGSQMGRGFRSGMQQKLAGVMNGSPNSGMVMNGTSEGFLSGPSFADSPRSIQQAFDNLQRSGIHGERLSAKNLQPFGSGDLYGAMASDASTTNAQTSNSTGLRSLPEIKPSLISNQSISQGMQQGNSMKHQSINQFDTMGFQPSLPYREHMLQSHHQQFQQQPHQFKQQQQYVHQQPQLKQENQQKQRLINNDAYGETHLVSDRVTQVKQEPRLEQQNNVMQSQAAGQHQPSHLRNQYESNSAEQMPQMFHPQYPFSDSQADFSSLSAGTKSESGLQGQWRFQSQENTLTSRNMSNEQHILEGFSHRMPGIGEQEVNNFYSEGSSGGQGHALGETHGSLLSLKQVDSKFISGNENRDPRYKNQQRWLLYLRHARFCKSPEGKCIDQHCVTVQKLWRHMDSCDLPQCSYPRCHPTKKLINHYKNCKDSQCPVCVPVKNYLQQQAKACYLARLKIDSSICESGRSNDSGQASAGTVYSAPSCADVAENLHPSLKRLKVEMSPEPVVTEIENSKNIVFLDSEKQLSRDVDMIDNQCNDGYLPVKPEASEVKAEGSAISVQGSYGIGQLKKDIPEYTPKRRLGSESVIHEEPAFSPKQERVTVDKETGVPKKEILVQPSESMLGSKSGKPTVKGVSLTELFTPEQVREHIRGLRQWVGQSKTKVEKNQALGHSMSENSCQLCAVEKLTFEPPPIYCTPCGARIKRNAMYYTVGAGETRHNFCIPCYNESRGDAVVAEGTKIAKARLEKKKNDEETEEWWVQCDKCEAWQHQICALFNGRRNDGGQAEYTCPNCYIEEVERGERKPLPQSAVLGAKDLPTTILSDHIEKRLFGRLKQERLERARVQGKSYDEVPGAEALVVRVVSSVDKKLEVKPRFLEIFREENYPTEFPYKSKVVLLFQKIEGVEVCLFGMYVQEFGTECAFPNQRRVYLSYLDSVKYFRPEVKSVSGEALRTFVYHEILIGYLEYCKLRGFTSCYIWACPPLKGEDYILYCHPEIQKTPKSDKLREWYLSMLKKAAKERVVVECTNLYDHFFMQTGECKAKVTAARLPYFDGDYWPGAAEDLIHLMNQEEDGSKHNKKSFIKKTITKRALKASGQSDLSGNASKDLLLMHKLGETIHPMKEDFIMVHLQYCCTHCCALMASGNRWVCSQCKTFQICDKCYEAEQRREDRERHPSNLKEKHTLYPVEITEVPADTKDKDEILESEFFDTRQAFLSLCQGNHYQYDTLRRAKHSSMMVLYHLHNPTAPAFVTTCNACHLDIEAGQGWRCEICPDYDVCNACYSKEGGVNHPHKLTNHPSLADQNAQNKEARQLRVLQLRKMLDLLVHASQCRSPFCQYPNCRKVKGLFRHGIQCRVRASGGCVLCKKMWYLLQIHARACKESQCHVPRCKDLKDHLKRLQQQSDSRRRAAVMEMMRQRAAEVAGNSG